MFKWLFASALAENAAPLAQTSAPAFADTLMGKGLITTGLGLAGVFLVLCLFYVVIKAMQRVKE